MYTLLRTRHVFQAKRGKGEELKLFIGNLPEKVTPRQVRDLFEQHGPVSLVSMGDGCGFVDMTFPQHAIAATRRLNGSQWNNRTLYVVRARRTAITKARELFEQ